MAAPILQFKRGTTTPGSIFYAAEPAYDTTAKILYLGDAGGAGSGAGTAIASASATSAATAILRETTAGTSAGIILLEETGSGTDSVTIQVPALSASYTLTLPANDGDAGQVLQTNGTGGLTWVNQTSGYSGWTISDGTTSQEILSGNTVTVTGGTGIDATVSATDTLTIAIDNTVATSSSKLSFFAATTSAELAGVISDETGSGSLVFSTSPSLTTPNIGAATATSVNKVTITAPTTSATLTIADGKTLTASNTLTFTGTDGSSVAFGTGGTVAYTGGNLGQFSATTSAQLAGVISDETGSGLLVFATSPTMSTSIVSGTASFDLIDTTATTVNFAGAATTGNYGYDGTATSTSNLSTGAVGSGNTKTVNIGTGGAAGSTTNVNLGSTAGTSTVTVNGNLTVTGTTTTVNSTVVTIADTNIVLANGAADAAAADGAGLTIDGANATWSFENNFVESASEAAWVTSEHLAIAADKNFYMDGGAIIVLDDTSATTAGYVSMLNTIIDAGTY